MDFRVWKYALPLKTPVSLAPGSTMSVREGLLLETIEGGRSFWGEAAPLPGFSRESLDGAARELEVAAGRYVATMNSDSDGSDEILDEVGFVADAPPSVRFALDLAVADYSAAVSEGDSLPEAVGPFPRDSLALCGLLSGPREGILSEAADMRAAGYEAVKLKVGRGAVEDDAALSRAVREILGESVSLRLDANRAWSFEDAARFARLAPDLGLEFVEEPLSQPGRLGEFARVSGLPVALDESLAGIRPGEVSKHPYARAFVLKPMLVGFYETQHFDNEAIMLGHSAATGNGRPSHAKTVVSAAYESGIGTLGLISLATSMRAGNAAVGLDTYRRLAEDVIHPPLDLSKPRLDMNEIFSVRREVDYEKLERVI